MTQMSFSDAEYAGKRKQTRRERFLVQLVTLFALSNLWMARRHLLTGAGEVRL